MSGEENKALVRRFLEDGYQEALRGNVDVAHEYFADHYHDHTSMHPEQPGVHGLKELIADASQATPDYGSKSWISLPTGTSSSSLAGDRHA